MKLSNQPLVPGSPVEFVCTGFPVEEGIVASVERFYSQAPKDTHRRFLIYNAYEELIFFGTVDLEGRVESMEDGKRELKNKKILET